MKNYIKESVLHKNKNNQYIHGQKLKYMAEAKAREKMRA